MCNMDVDLTVEREKQENYTIAKSYELLHASLHCDYVREEKNVCGSISETQEDIKQRETPESLP